jgi:hypothetical protein
MRELYENTGTITGDGVATATATVVQIDAYFQRTLYDVVRFATLHVDY